MAEVHIRRTQEQVPAWVTDLDFGDHRFSFIRLVPRGTAHPANTISVDFADIDVDDEGNIIGITIPSWTTE